MRSRLVSTVAAGLIAGLLVLPSVPAQAQTCDAASVRKLKKLNMDAMDENDRWDLAKARQKLEDAKLVAQSRGCLKHKQLAVTYAILGVVELRTRKQDAMKAAWTKALQIDPAVKLPRRVQSGKVNRLFAWVKSQVKPIAPTRRAAPVAAGQPALPTGPPKGFEHFPLVKWEEGKTLTLFVRAATNLAVQRVSLFLTTDSGTTKRLEFIQGGGDKWTWKLVVPGSLLRGKQFKYYIVAYTAGDKEVAASGNSANLNLVQLTSAAISPRRRAGSGMENPLTGGTYKGRARPRRVAARVDHPLENPDERAARRRASAPTRTTVRKRRAPAKANAPIFFGAIGLGTGIGLMAGHTEITDEAVPKSPSLGSLYGQVELGYLITRNFSVDLFGRFGYLFISDAVKDPRNHDIDRNPQGNDKDVVVLVRVRYQSHPLLRADLPVNLRWYVGGGGGWGILRHLVNGKHPVTGAAVVDTDRSTGFVPNVFGGVSLSVTRSGAISVFFEVNYLATFTSDTDLNTPFHMDFTLGANFAF